MDDIRIAHSARPHPTRRTEAQERFEAASHAFFLLADTGCPEARLNRVAQVMDYWARKIAPAGSTSGPAREL